MWNMEKVFTPEWISSLKVKNVLLKKKTKYQNLKSVPKLKKCAHSTLKKRSHQTGRRALNTVPTTRDLSSYRLAIRASHSCVFHVSMTKSGPSDIAISPRCTAESNNTVIHNQESHSEILPKIISLRLRIFQWRWKIKKGAHSVFMTHWASFNYINVNKFL